MTNVGIAAWCPVPWSPTRASPRGHRESSSPPCPSPAPRDQIAPVLHRAPERAPRGRRRPPSNLLRPPRVHQVLRVPALHEEQDPRPRQAPGPKALRHAPPDRVTAEGHRDIGLQDRVRVPRPQGPPDLAVGLCEQVPGHEPARATLGGDCRRPVLQRLVAVRAVLGPRARVLARALSGARAGALLEVRGDAEGPCSTRPEAGGVRGSSVQRWGGGGRRGGCHCEAVFF
uniref:Uncharacterized protein n=1 Tax=Setaria viridis TaxID=4556 RepID=A0A4U6TRG6_SETVI|nr:hypothetical protein SEVIR_7G183901v2 [Setaria viridis]